MLFFFCMNYVNIINNLYDKSIIKIIKNAFFSIIVIIYLFTYELVFIYLFNSNLEFNKFSFNILIDYSK